MATLFENYIAGDDSFWSIYGTTWWVAQSFTVQAGEAHTLTLVKLLVKRADSAAEPSGAGSPGTITVSIRAADAEGRPTGDDLSTGTFDGDALTIDPAGEWKEVTMSEVSLAAGTQYAIVVRAPSGDVDNQLRWRTDSTSPTYAGGLASRSDDQGSSWTAFSDYDNMFEEWGNPPSVLKGGLNPGIMELVVG